VDCAGGRVSGEDELQALAEGVLRVLCGEELAREYVAT
jgi:butyrate kinase